METILRQKICEEATRLLALADATKTALSRKETERNEIAQRLTSQTQELERVEAAAAIDSALSTSGIRLAVRETREQAGFADSAIAGLDLRLREIRQELDQIRPQLEVAVRELGFERMKEVEKDLRELVPGIHRALSRGRAIAHRFRLTVTQLSINNARIGSLITGDLVLKGHEILPMEAELSAHENANSDLPVRVERAIAGITPGKAAARAEVPQRVDFHVPPVRP